MKDPKQNYVELQIFYEIAMSIGNRLELDAMLKESLQTYLRKLDFMGGTVFRTMRDRDGLYFFEKIFSIPRRLDGNEAFRSATRHLPNRLEKEALKGFTDRLPLVGDPKNSVNFCIMELADFGALVLIFQAEKLSESLMNTLMPINDKLAWACIACFQNRRLLKEIERREKLEKAQRLEAFGNLAGSMAHDFNNILFPILGWSEILLEDYPENSPKRKIFQDMLNSAKRGRDLVKQILSFSRGAEHGKLPLSLHPILMDVCDLCRSTIPKDIDMASEIRKDCGMVLANPAQVHQIAMNLITNAYHAVRENGGRISVRLEEIELKAADLFEDLTEGKFASLTVADDGCGIDPSLGDKIFEPFFTTKKKEEGTGLGLSLVYAITRELGGAVKVESEPGRGASFQVLIPLLDEKRDIESGTNKKTADPEGSERIMVIDDEKAIAGMEKEILKRLGYSVKAFTSSLEALDFFRADPQAFDMVVTDQTMPDMNGDRLAQKILSIRSDMPIVLCTGFSEIVSEKKAKEKGFKSFLMKPVSKSNMARAIREALDGQSLPRPSETSQDTDKASQD